MGWERRRNGIYYYRTVRDGSRTHKVYCGGGETGRQAAEADEAARAARAETARLRAEQHQPFNDFAAELALLDEALDRLVTCRLLCDGWKQHHREWRRPRHDRRQRPMSKLR